MFRVLENCLEEDMAVDCRDKIRSLGLFLDHLALTYDDCKQAMTLTRF